MSRCEILEASKDGTSKRDRVCQKTTIWVAQMERSYQDNFEIAVQFEPAIAQFYLLTAAPPFC